MDQRLIFGLSISILFGFGRWLWPAVPRWFAAAGVSSGFGLLLWSFMPFIKAGPASLAIAAFALLAVAGVWQFSRGSPDAEAFIRSSSSPNPSDAHEHVPRSSMGAASQKVAKEIEGVVGDKIHPRDPDQEGVPERRPSAIQDESVERAATLKQLTKLYIQSHDGISPRMLAGMELPPVDFLNEELDRQRSNWRVRSTDGNRAEIYEVEENLAKPASSDSGI